MPVPKLIRPGDDCPDCGHLLYPHCTHQPWWKCGWVRCAKCRAYGTHKAWVHGRVLPSNEETPGDEAQSADGASPGE